MFTFKRLHFVKDLLWLLSNSSFRKAKSFLRGMHAIIVNNICDSFIISFQVSCKSLYGSDTVGHHTLWPQTQLPLTGQQVWQISLPHRGMTYLEKLFCDQVFLFFTLDAHLCLHCQWRPTDGMVTSSICSLFPSSMFICTSKELHKSHFNHKANQLYGSPLLKY